jgi:hypothetical protein
LTADPDGTLIVALNAPGGTAGAPVLPGAASTSQ